MLKKIAIGIVCLALMGAGYAYVAYGSIARAGTGFAAKNTCSGYFLSGFSPEVMADQALRGTPVLGTTDSTTLDVEGRRVSTSLYGLFERHAIYTPGIGCTLLAPGEDDSVVEVQALPPLQLSDELAWPQGTATGEINPGLTSILDEAFAETDPSQPRNTKAVVVIHEGELIAEKYAEGVEVDTPLIGWSMTKSVTALITGLLVKDGLLDIEAPAPVPQWQTEEGDPRAEITLDQLLRMSSGLEFDETYTGNTDVFFMLALEPDAAVFAASKPLAGPPDTIWSYSSGTTNIIAAINHRAAGGTAQEAYTYSQSRLFRPLGIGTATIETDSGGTFIGSSYMYASARDWARLGQFVLQDGVWEGEQLLPEGWVEYLITPTKTAEANRYGAQFWLNRDPTDTEAERAYPSLPADTVFMNGYQGQSVLIIPSQELVITRFGFTAGDNADVEELVAAVIAELN